MKKSALAFKSSILLAATCMGFFGVAHSADIVISNPAQFATALDTASSGDRLLLAPGDYGAISIRDKQFNPAIEITAAEQNARPVITEIDIEDVSGLEFSEISVRYGATTAPRTTYVVTILRGSDIQFHRSTFESAADGNPDNDAQAFIIRDSSEVMIKDSAFHDLFRGVAVLDSTDTTISASVFKNMSSDGIVGRGDHGVLIENNLFKDFYLTAVGNVHPDAIQFWDNGAARENRNLTIRGNVILRGSGDPSQGIFIKSGSMASQNIQVTDNLIQQSMTQGIFLENIVGAVVRNNTVAPFVAGVDKPGIEIRVPASGVEVHDNLAMSWRLAGAVLESGNLSMTVGNPWQENFAEKFLLSPFVDIEAAPADFTALTATGAQDFVTTIDSYDDADAVIVSNLVDASPMAFQFSLAPPFDEALADWTFTAPDGTVETGTAAASVQNKTFSSSGLWLVSARFTDGAGNLIETEKQLRVFPRMLIDMAFPGSVTQSAPEPVAFTGDLEGITLSPGGGAAFFNGLPASAGGMHLQTNEVAALTGSPTLSISLRVRRPSPSAGWERLVSLPGAYDIRMKGDRLRFIIWDENGGITSADDYVAGISDGLWHDVVCSYDGEAGTLTIEIDGAVAATKSMAGGNIAYQTSQVLYFGGAPWHNTFSGEIESFKITR